MRHHTVRRHVFIWSLVLGAVSLAVIVGGYLGAQMLLEADLDVRLQQRADILRSAAERGRDPAVLATIRRFNHRGLRSFSYRLTSPAGLPLFGARNLPVLQPGWGRVRLFDLDDQSDDLARVLTLRLPGGSTVSLVADTDYIDAFDQTVLLILVAALTLTCVVALAAGISLNRVVLNRLGAINGTAAALAALPDLSVRVPVTNRHDEFDAVAATCNAMLARIDGLVAENALVLGYVAHDLRAPLVRLAERLADARAAVGDEADRLLDAAEEDVADVLHLFDAFLAIGRHDKRAAGEREPIDLSARVRDLAESFAVVAEASGRDLGARIEPNLGIRADGSLISQLVVNLLENAIRHTPDGTLIDLSLTAAGDHAQLIVSDNAREIGGAEPNLARRESDRGDRQRLGLKLIRSVAEAHGGSFAHLQTAQGTTAQVLLPLAAHRIRSDR